MRLERPSAQKQQGGRPKDERRLRGPAAELVRAAPKTLSPQARHEKRVLETVWASLKGGGAPHLEVTGAQLIRGAFSLVLDETGVGGPSDLRGSARDRYPLFRGLGKGLKLSPDWPAWRRASTDARERMLAWAAVELDTETAALTITPSAPGERAYFLLSLGASSNMRSVPFHAVDFFLDEREPGARWAKAFAARAMVAASGRTEHCPLREFNRGPSAAPISAERDVHGWGEMFSTLNSIEHAAAQGASLESLEAEYGKSASRGCGFAP